MSASSVVDGGELYACAATAERLRWRIIAFEKEKKPPMLLDLPVEILSEILVLLDYRSILHSSAVSVPLPPFLSSSQSAPSKTGL
jgi:hypothetical protein